ncbi:Helicase associated domain protein [Streptomyces liliifuscus]|uniref:Helicase associated domain protein n=2 Tax=Streptomyces liliifuscus TaxID=2797636 RepID=A0A7T7HZC0_9ACTN|nr:Helicase associated domain protein [Streptomyces liliifuscus]
MHTGQPPRPHPEPHPEHPGRHEQHSEELRNPSSKPQQQPRKTGRRHPGPGRHAALTSQDTSSPAVRGARLAAVQAGLMRAAVEERFRRVLAFHSRIGEAEAMAAGVPAVAARLAEDDPGTFPAAELVWANWLYGEHSPIHRRRVLEEFASDFLGAATSGDRDIPAVLRVLSSVRVLGEGVDTAECDAVLFADARGSMVDIVQMVGRALRMQPGAGKLATLIVPVFLGPDEDPDDMLTSDAYSTLTKVLEALRAHDTETIEALADPRLRNSSPTAEPDDAEGEFAPDADDPEQQGEDVVRVSGAAAGVLRFSEERDPFALTQFIRLRVIDPEGAYWRRGIEAATRWLRETGNTELRVPYTFAAPTEWGAVGGYPLGRWIADLRRYYTAGTLQAARVVELETLGMVWSAWDTAFTEGLTVAHAWAAAHGHLLPPATAVAEDGFPIGTWTKNQRAAARRTLQNTERRAAGETGIPSTGELPESRMEALEAIDPGWCPAWEIGWQRCFRLTLTHLRAGGGLPRVSGKVIVQGEDLGSWTAAQRTGWDRLLPAQQWLLANTLGIEPAAEGEAVGPVRRSQDERWATHLAAARRFHTREGHLNAGRKHVERMEDGTEVKLGGWLDNTRRRATKITPERRAELDELGMRW